MFRLIRLVIFVFAAFMAGIIWGDIQGREACNGYGGVWTTGICIMSELPNE